MHGLRNSQPKVPGSSADGMAACRIVSVRPDFFTQGNYLRIRACQIELSRDFTIGTCSSES